MKAVNWRQGVATLLAAGFLAVGAVAQEGAEGEVTITEGDSAEVTASEKPADKGRPKKPKIVDRDPFVNMLATGQISGGVTATRRSSGSSDDGGEDISDDEMIDDSEITEDENSSEEPIEEPVVEEVEILAPDVTVNGIVSSGSGRQAIISTPNGTQMIRAGQKLGDYYVSYISSKSVTFSYAGQKSFEIPLAAEFGG